MREKYFLILILVASLTIKVPLALITNSFGVDESLYLATAREFVETGKFGIRTEFYDFKFIPPLFPSLASAFFAIGGEKGVLLISPIFSSLTIILFYFLGKFLFDVKVGRVAALIALFNPGFILLGTRPLTESVAIFFFTFAVLAMYLMLKDRKFGTFVFAFPVLFALTAMTRFQYGGILIILFIAYLFYTRKFSNVFTKYFFLGIVAALAIASPWLIFNLQSFGNLLGGPVHQATTDLGFNPFVAYLYIPYLFIIIGSVIPFVFYGIYKSYKHHRLFLLLAFLAIFLTQFFVFGKVAEERYLLPIIPVAALLGAIGFLALYDRFKKISLYSFTVLLAINLLIGLAGISFFMNLDRYNETREAVLSLKENCESPIMSNSFTHVWYYADYENIPVKSSQTESINLAKERGVSCIMFSEYEAPFIDYFEGSGGLETVFKNKRLTVYRIL